MGDIPQMECGVLLASRHLLNGMRISNNKALLFYV
jgi:hypothetical protein